MQLGFIFETELRKKSKISMSFCKVKLRLLIVTTLMQSRWECLVLLRNEHLKQLFPLFHQKSDRKRIVVRYWME